MTKEQQLIQAIGIDLRLEQVTVGGYVLNYVTAGQGPVVVFLHGANIGWGQWYKTIAPCTQFFTVIAVDLPGTGGSTKVHYRKTDILSQTLSVVEKFIQIIQTRLSVTSVALVGHSFGGWVALQIMRKRPDIIRCCVVSNPIGFSSEMPLSHRLLGIYPVAWVLTKTVLKPHQEKIEAFLSDACRDKNALEDIFSEYVHESMHRSQLSHPFLFIHALLSGFRLRKELIFEPGTLDGANPTCVIFGTCDPIVSYEVHKLHCSALLPKASIITYNTGHVPMLEQPDQFNKDLVSFLRKYSPACQYGVLH